MIVFRMYFEYEYKPLLIDINHINHINHLIISCHIQIISAMKIIKILSKQ